MIAQIPLVIKTHLYLPLPVRMYIVLPSVHPISDSDLGVSDEVETCIPSPVASPDLNGVTTYSSEEVSEALSPVESALSHAYAVLEHSLTCDI